MSLYQLFLNWWRHRHDLRYVHLLLKTPGGKPKVIERILLGATVSGQIDGHSATNGAVIPDGSTITLTSSVPLTATVPATVAVPTGGAPTVDFPITVLATGNTDIHVLVMLPDGTTFADTATLIVNPDVIPANQLTHVTLTLVSPAAV